MIKVQIAQRKVNPAFGARGGGRGGGGGGGGGGRGFGGDRGGGDRGRGGPGGRGEWDLSIITLTNSRQFSEQIGKVKVLCINITTTNKLNVNMQCHFLIRGIEGTPAYITSLRYKILNCYTFIELYRGTALEGL